MVRKLSNAKHNVFTYGNKKTSLKNVIGEPDLEFS